MSRAIMIQGTGSNVGKSLIAAGLCRYFHNRGFKVRPFKPQNMSNNAAVTVDGGEIGRSQALQAKACGVEPHSLMNPVLLKPETENGAQVILKGQRFATVKSLQYDYLKEMLMTEVLNSFKTLSNEADLVIVEGAGSPAESNLRAGDIANMGFAEEAQIPVILVGNIDLGGVIAQLVGTYAVLPETDRRWIKGFIVNKFRGDPALFAIGMQDISNRTGWRSFGILPWFEEAVRLPAEDAVDIKNTPRSGTRTIAVPRLPCIANFDDLDPLLLEPDLHVDIVEPGRALPADADWILIPGSKSTTGDLRFLRNQGWDIDLLAHHRRGGKILGICGGYQMLGKTIIDRDGLEGTPGATPGLGLLDVVTEMLPQKTLTRISGHHRSTGVKFSGYEIHIGNTQGPDCDNFWLEVEGRPEGAASADGRVRGCYVHGLFTADDFRQQFVDELGAQSQHFLYGAVVEDTLDLLADHIETHLNVDSMLQDLIGM